MVARARGPRSRLPPLAASLAVLLLVLTGPVSTGAGPTSIGPSGAPHPAIFKTSVNGNFSIWVNGPGGVFAPGAYARGQLIVALPANATVSAPLQVWVPGTVTTFQTTNGPLRIFHPGVNMTLLPGSARSQNLTNLTTLLPNGGTFNASALADLSSQLAAVMTNLPYGAIGLTVSFRWQVAQPDGSTATGAWSPPKYLQPAEYASLMSWGPTSLVPGQTLAVCIAGAVAGRLFSLHVETINPVDDFVQVNSTGSAGNGPLCWSATVPTWVTPQPLLAHIWDYAQVTLLLYIIKVSLLNSTPSAGGLFGSGVSPGTAVNAAALAVGGGWAAFLGVRWLRTRRRSRRSPRRPERSDPPAQPPTS